MSETWLIPGRLATGETEWTVIARAFGAWVFVAPHPERAQTTCCFPNCGERYSSKRGTGVPLVCSMAGAVEYATVQSIIAPPDFSCFRAVPTTDLMRYGLSLRKAEG